jgi:hypothetical protein
LIQIEDTARRYALAEAKVKEISPPDVEKQITSVAGLARKKLASADVSEASSLAAQFKAQCVMPFGSS